MKRTLKDHFAKPTTSQNDRNATETIVLDDNEDNSMCETTAVNVNAEEQSVASET